MLLIAETSLFVTGTLLKLYIPELDYHFVGFCLLFSLCGCTRSRHTQGLSGTPCLQLIKPSFGWYYYQRGKGGLSVCIGTTRFLPTCCTSSRVSYMKLIRLNPFTAGQCQELGSINTFH